MRDRERERERERKRESEATIYFKKKRIQIFIQRAH